MLGKSEFLKSINVLPLHSTQIQKIQSENQGAFPDFMQKIPFEVWVLIINFLPDIPSKSSLTVCRSLYVILLSDKCWEQSVSNPPVSYYAKFFDNPKLSVSYKPVLRHFIENNEGSLAKRTAVYGRHRSKYTYYNICIAGNNSNLNYQLSDTITALIHGHPWAVQQLFRWNKIDIHPIIWDKRSQFWDKHLQSSDTTLSKVPDVILIIAQTPDDLFHFKSEIENWHEGTTKRKYFCVCLQEHEQIDSIKLRAKQLVIPVLEINTNDLFVNPNKDGSGLVEPVRDYVSDVMGKGVSKILDAVEKYIQDELKLEASVESNKSYSPK